MRKSKKKAQYVRGRGTSLHPAFSPPSPNDRGSAFPDLDAAIALELDQSSRSKPILLAILIPGDKCPGAVIANAFIIHGCLAVPFGSLDPMLTFAVRYTRVDAVDLFLKLAQDFRSVRVASTWPPRSPDGVIALLKHTMSPPV